MNNDLAAQSRTPSTFPINNENRRERSKDTFITPMRPVSLSDGKKELKSQLQIQPAARRPYANNTLRSECDHVGPDTMPWPRMGNQWQAAEIGQVFLAFPGNPRCCPGRARDAAVIRVVQADNWIRIGRWHLSGGVVLSAWSLAAPDRG
jgi:hypothetical protein